MLGALKLGSLVGLIAAALVWSQPGPASSAGVLGTREALEESLTPEGAPTGEGVAEPQASSYVPGEVLVKFKPGVEVAADRIPGQRGRASNEASVNALLKRYDVSRAGRVFPAAKPPRPGSTIAVEGRNVPAPDLTRVHRLGLGAGADVLAAVEDFANDPSVEYAEPNYVVGVKFTPDDPLLGSQWGLGAINAYTAWDIQQGMAAVRIAIIDTGVDLDHPDLSGKLWTNPGEIPGDELDNDANGLVDDVNGWDFVNLDNDPQDDNGHGTHVAGIAAASTNNALGIAGACPNCTIMPLKGLQSSGRGNIAELVQAIDYAANKGAKAINMSWGLYADSATLKTALTNAFPTAVLVAAAGNDGRCIGPGVGCAPFFPAAYSFVVGVEAEAQSGGLAGFTNYDQDGPTTSAYADQWNYEIRAPGSGIQSTKLDDTFGSLSGTSMAAPFVAGAVGLLIAENPTWSKEKIRAQIIQTASSGLVDAYAALTVTPTANVDMVEGSETIDDSTGDNDGRVDAGETINLSLTLRNYGAGEATGVTATLTTTDAWVTMLSGASSFGDISAYATNNNSGSPFSFSVDSATPNNHDITFTLDISVGGSPHATATFFLTVQRGTEIGGVIDTDTTFTSDRAYIVTANTLVASGATLTIEPGTEVRFDPTHYIVVEGTLSAVGTPAQPIVFTSNVDTQRRGSLIFHNTATANEIGYAIIENAGETVGLFSTTNRGQFLWLFGSFLHMHDSICRDSNCLDLASGGGGIAAGTTFDHVLFTDTGSWPVRVGAISNAPLIQNSTLAGNTGGAILKTSSGGGLMLSVDNSNLCGNGIYDIFAGTSDSSGDVDASDNYWCTTDPDEIAERIWDYNDTFTGGVVTFDPVLTSSPSTAPPILENLQLTTDSGVTDPVGVDRVTATLDFSTAMDTSAEPGVTFGVAAPYTQHSLAGVWLSPTQWEGSHDVDVTTGDGGNTIRVADALSSNSFFPAPTNTDFQFNIQTVGSSSLLLNASAAYSQVALDWGASDLETLGGYNVYRSTTSGSYSDTPIASMLQGTAHTDTTVVNGTTYYYQYAIVDTDLREVAFSNEVSALPGDFTPPSTPVVSDDGDTTTSTTTLHATWSASDPESGIDEYEYGIGTWPGDVDVVNWTSVGTDTEVTRGGLNLQVGTEYWFAVEARNGMGTWSSAGISDGITVAAPTATATPTNTATPTITPTPTITNTPTITPTPTNTPLGPTATPTKQASPGDTDGDGCSDQQENGPDPQLGGQRDYRYFWDFYDVWTRPVGDPSGWERNAAIDLFGDIFGVANRFGASGDPNADPLVPPTSDSGYHPAFDRGALIGPNPWDLGPADGSIDLFIDIFGVANQFGHDCT